MLSNHLLVLKPVWEGFSLEEWTGSQQIFIIFIYLQKFLSQELIKQKGGWNYLHELFEIHFFQKFNVSKWSSKTYSLKIFLGFDLLAWINLLKNFFAQFSWSLAVQLPELSARLQAASNRTQFQLEFRIPSPGFRFLQYKFAGFHTAQARISRILESGFPYIRPIWEFSHAKNPVSKIVHNAKT